MSEQLKMPRNSILDAQAQINHAEGQIDRAHRAFRKGEISYRVMEDQEQYWSIQGQIAATQRQEAEDAALGKRLSLPDKIRRGISKFIFG